MSGQLTAPTVSSVSVRASGSGSWAHGHAADGGAPGSGLGTCSRRSAACGSGGRREVCKTVGSAYVGSNPTPATTCGNGPPGCGYAPGRPFSSRHAVYRGPPRRAEVRATRGRRGRARRSQAKVAARAEHRLRRRDPGPGGGHGSRGRGGVFAVARTAGWIAHALEAYAGGGSLRPRAVYTGPPAIIDP